MLRQNGKKLPENRRNVKRNVKRTEGQVSDKDVRLLLYRSLETFKRRETRKMTIEEPNSSRRQKRILSEIKSLKIMTEALKRAGVNLIRNCVASALGLSKSPKGLPKYAGGGRETEKERRLRCMYQLRAGEERKREMAKIKGDKIPLGQQEKVPISIKNIGIRQLFVCIVCNEEFDTQGGMFSHFMYHTESDVSGAKEKLGLSAGVSSGKNDIEYRMVPVHKCELCPKKFFTLSVYRSHAINSHYEDREFIEKTCFACSLCEQVFNAKYRLVVHRRDSHGIFTRCPVCDEDVKTQELFSKHLEESHPCYSKEGQMVFGYAEGYFCKICGLSNKGYSHVSSHSLEHSQHKSFQCDICQQKFSEIKLLNSHKETRHTEKTFCCEVCGKAFTNRRSLRLHHRTHKEIPNSNNKPVECTKCGKTFASMTTLNVHDSAAHQKRSWQCTICEKSFTCGSALHQHKTTVCEKDKASPRICPLCGKSLDNYVLLSYHKSNFHKFGNTEETFCHVCKKTFKDSCALYAHNRAQHLSNDKNQPDQLKFKCAVCDKSWPNKMFLLEHWRMHREERPFKCNLCEITFKYATRFHQHKKSAHKNEMEEAKMITDAEAQKKLKEDFRKVHASQFLKNVTTRPNFLFKAVEPETVYNIPKNTDVCGDDNIMNTKKDNLNQSAVTAALVTERNDTDKIYVDFSRANVPVVLEGKQEDASKHRGSSIDCREIGDDSNIKQAILILSLQDNVVADEFTESTDDLFCPPSPLDYFDSEIVKYEESEIEIVTFTSYEKPRNLRNTNLTKRFSKELRLKIEKLKQCLVCNKFFPSSDLLDNHLRSDEHQMAMKESKKEVITTKRKKKTRSKRSKSLRAEDLFRCPLCSEEFTALAKYRRHLAQHKSRVRCLLCTEKFVTVRKLVDHYISEHNGEKVEKCKVCGKGYLNYRTASGYYELLRHMEREHGQGKRKKVRCERNYFCDTCGEKCLGMTSFRTHVLSHNDDEHKCVHCAQEFQRPIELENHYNETHNGDMPFPCHTCHQKFLTDFRLQSHKKKVHPKDKKMVCDVCGKKFLLSSELKKHIDRHNPVEERRKFVCDFCGKLFVKADSLSIHRKTHTGVDLFPCTICGNDVAFISKKILKAHMDRVHNKDGYVCDFCGKSFIHPRGLADHRKTHSPENGLPCSQCSKIFYTLKNLNRHIKTVHNNVKGNNYYPKFACEVCPDKFHKPEGLKKHSELHDPARPFGCDQCTWRFKHTSNLQFHKKNVHEKMGIVYPKKKKIKSD